MLIEFLSFSQKMHSKPTYTNIKEKVYVDKIYRRIKQKGYMLSLVRSLGLCDVLHFNFKHLLYLISFLLITTSRYSFLKLRKTFHSIDKFQQRTLKIKPTFLHYNSFDI